MIYRCALFGAQRYCCVPISRGHMRRSFWLELLVVCFLTVSSAWAEGRDPETFEKAINYLRTVERIETPYIGFSGMRAHRRFFRISKVCLASGGEEDFKRLLQDKHPMVRAMGLTCLAKLGLDEHGEKLTEFVQDKGKIALLEGCVASTITVGQLAVWLLDDPDVLDFKAWGMHEKRKLSTESAKKKAREQTSLVRVSRPPKG